MREKYKGPVGSEKAMDAIDPAFMRAYSKASALLMDAVLEFERTTFRSVINIEIDCVDITSIEDASPRSIRTTTLRFLPKPSEVSW